MPWIAAEGKNGGGEKGWGSGGAETILLFLPLSENLALVQLSGVSASIELPSYQEQSPEVQAYFRQLYEQPVVLDVQKAGRIFSSPKGDVEALRDIDVQVRSGEFISVIGQSGCGKSTFIRILAGLERTTSGQALLDGKQIDGPGPDRGMVFQSYTLFPWLTVKKNVMFGLEVAGEGPHGAEETAMQWLELVGLKKFANSYPHELSGGMKQRTSIARALANQPRILLMDEPFGALDAQTRAQMQAYLLEIWEHINTTILFITHDLEEAVYLADRILVLGANPGHVQEIIEVPVPRPRGPEQFISPEFLATKKRLEDLIHVSQPDHLDPKKFLNLPQPVG